VTVHAHWHLVWAVACGFGAVAIGALAIVYRRARARHELEEAEKLLADDWHT
jgi:hypothetical protein